MSVECFLDAGILIYAVSAAPAERERKRKSLELIKGTDFGVSADVLQEFYVAATSRIRKPVAPETAIALLDEYRVFPVVVTDYPLIAAAAEWSVLHGISYRHGAVLAAARALDAPVVYSDAFAGGGVFGGIRVIDPYGPPPT